MTLLSPPRISGLLLVPLAWLLLSLLTSALVLVLHLAVLIKPDLREALLSLAQDQLLYWWATLLTSLLMLVYSFWLSRLFFQRSLRLPRQYIIWLLVSVLLALKSFAFSPVSNMTAVYSLLTALLAASVLVLYFKRSQRVKTTFTGR